MRRNSKTVMKCVAAFAAGATIAVVFKSVWTWVM